MKTEIRVIENRDKMEYRVTVNGKDEFKPFPYDVNNLDTQISARQWAKSCAFDIIISEQFNGRKFTVSYDSF